MEGLRALPWFQEALRRDDRLAEVYDCKKCKMTSPQLIRMSRGCGHEPRHDDPARLKVWQPPAGKAGYRDGKMTTCPGYTCSLPEVGEVALARVHWSKGNVDWATTQEELLNAIVVLDGQYNQVQSWLMTDAKDGGGRDGS